MKKIVILIILAGLLFSQAKKDTVKQIPYFDLSKGFNIPGIIPKNMPLANQFVLFPHEIEAIKQKAKDYILKPVSENDICLLYTSPSPRDGLLSRMPSSA